MKNEKNNKPFSAISLFCFPPFEIVQNDDDSCSRNSLGCDFESISQAEDLRLL
jgi:hypothetical protein